MYIELDDRYEHLSEDILNYRARHNMSRAEFSRKCGVSTQTVYGIETKTQTPSMKTVAKINLVLKGE